MSTTFLLDTHAFVWAASNPKRLSESTRKLLAVRDNVVLVSAASVWEVATKTRLGKFDGGQQILDEWEQAVRALAATELPVTRPHAAMAGSFAVDHRDPFDRMLAAQAVVEQATLVSVDEAFALFPVTTIR
jgi:PIN domain nuclease of toxin-antitoxin system